MCNFIIWEVDDFMIVSFQNLTNLFLLVFLLGFTGFFEARRHLISLILCAEILVFGSNLGFIGIGYFYFDITGQIGAFLVSSVAACEVAVLLAIVIVLRRLCESISVSSLTRLKYC